MTRLLNVYEMPFQFKSEVALASPCSEQMILELVTTVRIWLSFRPLPTTMIAD